ncbi:hypothetical protein PHMEG_00015912 [Phytophthora megakarya]|uniref:Integrase catalytic domain-containing protein n=1 Tax=Phytophthora megakarya TaxID=4795 RepID=A0A225W034_9STRA|nr:hypothetical protein PHMEG_00015912 [Phytophthora megakarya]
MSGAHVCSGGQMCFMKSKSGRKARQRKGIPPYRSLRGGDVCDRWAFDVVDHSRKLEAEGCYVLAAVEYVTRYVVVVVTEQHTATHIAAFLVKEIVLRFGVFRELLRDGAPELTGRVVLPLVLMVEADQTNPVPYTPKKIGVVERFRRTWKDCVSLHEQDDWEAWVAFAVYAYNSARHSTVSVSTNEPMMERKLRAPNNQVNVAEAGDLIEYHARLVNSMTRSYECAERQAKYYDRRVKSTRTFQTGDCVWMYKTPMRPNATKFVHRWIWPMLIVSDAGNENYLVRREDPNGELREFIAHVSFLTNDDEPTDALMKQKKTLWRSSNMKAKPNAKVMTLKQERLLEQQQR